MKNLSLIRAHALIKDKEIHAFSMSYAIPR